MIMKTDGSFAALAWNLILPQPPAPCLVLVVAELRENRQFRGLVSKLTLHSSIQGTNNYTYLESIDIYLHFIGGGWCNPDTYIPML